MKKKTMTAMFIYALLIASLIFSFKLADSVAEANPAMAGSSSLGSVIEGMATTLPLWVYVVIFIALALGVRVAMTRHYKRMYLNSREKLASRESYTHINRYKRVDSGFSNEKFAEMVGQKQELLKSCVCSGDFAPMREYVDEKLYRSLPECGLKLDSNMLQLEMPGFLQTQERDIISVILNCAAPKGLKRYEFEWLFERATGLETEDGCLPLNYGGWTLCSIELIS